MPPPPDASRRPRFRGRKRTLLMVLLLLAYSGGGAIINVAVAWGLAARRAMLAVERNAQGYFVVWGRPWQIVEERRLGMIDVWWYDLYDANPGSAMAEAIVAGGNGRRDQRRDAGEKLPSGRIVETLAAPPGWGSFSGEALPPDVVMGGDIGFGAPCVSLWMSTTSDVIGNRTANERLHGGWLLNGAVESRGNKFIALPLRPIWPGFAINTVFYAAILWLLFFAPGFVRRRIRARRGQCPACAYPVGTSNVCTECGRPVGKALGSRLSAISKER